MLVTQLELVIKLIGAVGFRFARIKFGLLRVYWTFVRNIPLTDAEKLLYRRTCFAYPVLMAASRLTIADAHRNARQSVSILCPQDEASREL